MHCTMFLEYWFLIWKISPQSSLVFWTNNKNGSISCETYIRKKLCYQHLHIASKEIGSNMGHILLRRCSYFTIGVTSDRPLKSLPSLIYPNFTLSDSCCVFQSYLGVYDLVHVWLLWYSSINHQYHTYLPSMFPLPVTIPSSS